MYRDGQLLDTSNTASFIDSLLTPSRQYCYSVLAIDKAKNESPSTPYSCAYTYANIIDNGNETLTDQSTNLMWQKSDTSTFYSWSDSRNKCDDLTLAGHSDWRLPSIRELASIMNFNSSDPYSIIPFSFSRDLSQTIYWTSDLITPHKSSPLIGWYVRRDKGHLNSTTEGVSNYISFRCVRGPRLPQSSFVDNTDGTISDTSTGVLWQQEQSSPMTWLEALNYCHNLEYAGIKGWRLPSITDLMLVSDFDESLILSKTFFPEITNTYHWSSTTSGDNFSLVLDESGVSNQSLFENKYPAICIKGTVSFVEGLYSITFYRDLDSDSYGDIDNFIVVNTTNPDLPAPEGYTLNKTDCDDSNSSMHPDSKEVFDSFDNDCDGLIDEKYAFLSSSTQNGNFGGVAGADSICQSLTDESLLPSGVYKAWISSSSESANSRLVNHDAPIVDSRDRLISNNWDSLTSNGLIVITVDEDGKDVSGTKLAWTNTDYNGEIASPCTVCTGADLGGGSCFDWTSNDEQAYGFVGEAGTTHIFGNWSRLSESIYWAGNPRGTGAGDQFLADTGCNHERRLYCFQQ